MMRGSGDRGLTLQLDERRDAEISEATGAGTVARGRWPFRHGAPVQPNFPPGIRGP